MKKKTFYLSLGLFFILSGLFFFLPPVDTDLGWHLRYGEYFLKHLKPMRENQLTYFLSGYEWKLSYLLSDAMAALVYKFFDLLGLSLANGLLFGIFGAFLFLFLEVDLFFSFLVLVTTVLFGWGSLRFGFRAQNFALLGTILCLYFLKKGEKDSRFFFLIPVLTLFWVNFHGSFVLSLIIFSLFIISQILIQKKLSPPILLAFLLTILAGIITPFGLGAYQEAWRHALYPLKLLIAEWVPPRPTFKIAVLATTFVSLFALAKKPKQSLFLTLLLLFFAWQASLARRNLPLFGLTLGLFWANWLTQEAFGQKFRKNLEKSHFGFIATASFVFLLFVIRVPQTFDFIKSEEAICNQGMLPYPCQAIDWVKKQAFLGQNVYSAYEWGGFLEWKLPEYKPFVDGRMPAWPTPSGKSPYTIYLEIIQARPGWEKELEKYQTDWLLIQTGTFLDIELKKKAYPIWKLTYQDEAASIYTKRK